MHKILLINPIFNIPKENYDSSISVGLLCLASYLDEKGIEVKMVDGVRQKNYLDLIKKELPQVDFVGISAMTTQVKPALEISKIVKDFNKDLPVIWGGLHPTFFPEETVEHPLIDIVVIGEGEETLLEIVQEKPFQNIKGIAFKGNNSVQVNSERPFLNFEDLPLPKWNLVPKEILENLALIPTHTSRGCPHRCTFCVNAIRKNRWRARNPEDVLKDLEIIVSQPYFKNKPIRFWDEDFFVDKERAMDIIHGMIEKNLNLNWETTIRADYLDEDFLDNNSMVDLKKSGCYLLSFGAESGSSKILKKIKKGVTIEQILNSAKRCLKHKIIPQYSFMVGLPGEIRKDVKQTIKLIDQLIKLSPNIQILGPQAFRPYPGSSLYEECLLSGWSAPQTLEQWAELMENELNYLSPQNFPWVKDPDFIESLEAYVRFGAHTIKSALGSTIKSNMILKLFFVLLCQLRWRLKFFSLSWDYKIAKKFITKT
ncbi:B12-binding domain-containing radical SAM protein [Patescibacteria group bacterium]|nr:B12-binding domain-containing radical SAM protein [Patescibacteria group bacterium]